MAAVDQEGKVGRIEDLAGLGDAFEELDQPDLEARVEMEPRLVKQQDGIFMCLPALDQENQIEGQEPLEALASLLKGYRKRAVPVGDLEDEVVAVDVEIQAMFIAGPEFAPVAGQCERSRPQQRPSFFQPPLGLLLGFVFAAWATQGEYFRRVEA